MNTAPDTSSSTPDRAMRKWIPLTAICLGTFMLLVDVSIVNVALPQMASDLHSSFTSLQWVVDMYALVLAALLMVVGALGDRLGHRKLYLFGLVVFALASLACGLAPNAGTLIAARAAQGIGGAAAVGPVLGGLLTDEINWRAIFFVNLPIAAVALYMTVRHLRDGQDRASGRLDYLGAVTFTVFSGALVYGLIESADKGWGSSTVLGSLALAVVALIAFAVVELRTGNPLLDLGLLRNRSFVGLTAAALLLNAAAFAHLTYTSIWLQSVLDLSPIQAGLVCCPLALAAFVVAGNSGRLFGKAAPQVPIGLGLLLIGTGVLLMTLVSADSSWTAVLPGLIVSGLGVGMATPIMMSAALATVPRERVGMASGAVNTGRQLGYALGIAVLGTVFANRIQDYVTVNGHLADPHAAASALSGGRAQAVLASVPADKQAAVHQLVHASFAAGLDRVYLIAGGTGIVAGLIVFALVRRGEPPFWEKQAPTPTEATATPEASPAH